MGSKYSTVSVSGYSATPPSDDGATTESNKVKYSTLKTKLGDPLNTAIAAVDSALTTHFNNGPTALVSSTTLDATHYNKIIQASGASTTLTLTDAATLTAGWYCEVLHVGTANITLARATASDMIDASSANITLYPLDNIKVMVNAAANGFLTTRKQNNSEKYSVAAGTNTYTATLDPVPLAYVTGTHYFITFTNANTSTTPTLNINSLGAKTIKKEGSGALVVGDIPALHAGILKYDGTDMILLNPAGRKPGSMVQRVEATPLATWTTITTPYISFDDNIPQNTEGAELVTVAITPTSGTNRLVIRADIPVYSVSVSDFVTMALFQDSTPDALAATAKFIGGNESGSLTLYYEMAAGAPSSTTFKIRAGLTANTLYVLGTTSARVFGGKSLVTLSVEEIAV